MVIETMAVIGWFKLQLWIWLVGLKYYFEFDWFIELSDNNLASELVEKRSFLKPTTIEEIVIFMITCVITKGKITERWLAETEGIFFNQGHF